MTNILLSRITCAIGLLIMITSLPCVVAAQTIPNNADINSIKPDAKPLPATPAYNPLSIPLLPDAISTPKNAENLHFILRDVKIKGGGAISTEILQKRYIASYVGKQITLRKVYEIADNITKHYRDAGYFLSLARVPPQRVNNGIITIEIIEGTIDAVNIKQTIRNHNVVQHYIDRLLAVKPMTSSALESFLLQMNDLPYYQFNGVLIPSQSKTNGTVTLELVNKGEEAQGSVRIDNHGSRFLGVHEVSAHYSKSLLPLQQTTLSGLSSVPYSTLTYGTLTHSAVIAPDMTLEISGGITNANPAFTLKPLDIESDAVSLSAGVNYQWIRQREENVSLGLTFDSRNSDSYILGSRLTRDRVRALRASTEFNIINTQLGYSAGRLTLSQGLKGFGSSDAGEKNLSRVEAVPNFTKLDATFNHLHALSNDWSMQASASGQIASDALFSSEEFGYGGQAFGRAYDGSELTGDHGVAGALEIQYGGWSGLTSFNVNPYAFYDIGVAWNKDIAQLNRESASSAGLGIRANTGLGVSTDVGLAFPLTREISSPIYGQTGNDPRLYLQMTKKF